MKVTLQKKWLNNQRLISKTRETHSMHEKVVLGEQAGALLKCHNNSAQTEVKINRIPDDIDSMFLALFTKKLLSVI